jgi:hypothetical protein
VNVLLRQAGGFEGSLLAREELEPHGHIAVEGPKHRAAVTNLDSVAAPKAHIADVDHLVGANFEDLIQLPLTFSQASRNSSIRART